MKELKLNNAAWRSQSANLDSFMFVDCRQSVWARVKINYSVCVFKVINEQVTQWNNEAAGFGLFMGFAEKKKIE